MRPNAIERTIAAPDAFFSVMKNDLFVSGVVSPLTGTSIVFDVSPGAKVSVPDAAT